MNSSCFIICELNWIVFIAIVKHFRVKMRLAFLCCANLIANEAADPRGSAVELANHGAVREYRRKISSQRKGPFFDHIWV